MQIASPLAPGPNGLKFVSVDERFVDILLGLDGKPLLLGPDRRPVVPPEYGLTADGQLVSRPLGPNALLPLSPDGTPIVPDGMFMSTDGHAVPKPKGGADG